MMSGTNSNSLHIEVKNYKLLKDKEFDLEMGSIYFLQGGNNKGKTTFINLLKAIQEVKDDTINPVTSGEKEGYSYGSIVGADGLTYQFRYDYNVDGKSKFVFIDPQGKQIKKVGDMRNIFNYNHMTIEQFFDLSKTESGRKKQLEFILNMLSDSDKEEINAIESKINGKDGELFIQRTDINRKYDSAVAAKNSIIIDPDDLKLLGQKKEYDATLKDVTERKKYIDGIINGNPELNAKLEIAESKKESIETNYLSKKEQLSYDINVSEDLVKNLEQQLIEAKEKLIENKTKLVNAETEYNTNILESSKDINALKEELPKMGDGETIDSLKEELSKIEARLEKAVDVKAKMDKAEMLTVQKETLDKDIVKYKGLSDSLTEQISTLRIAKKNIIQNSENIPSSIELTDDYITVDGIPFNESDISKSKATRAIARLMIAINKAPIMLMGDAEALGYDSLDELAELAKEHNKTMVFAEHVRYMDEPELICYDMIDKEQEMGNSMTSKPDNSLF